MAQALEGSRGSKKNGYAARDALKSRTTDVLDDFSELKKDMSRLADAANKAARAEVSFAGKRLETIGKSMRTRADDGVGYLTERARAHPGAVMGATLGAGLVLGMLLARRR